MFLNLTEEKTQLEQKIVKLHEDDNKNNDELR